MGVLGGGSFAGGAFLEPHLPHGLLSRKQGTDRGDGLMHTVCQTLLFWDSSYQGITLLTRQPLGMSATLASNMPK